METRLFFRARLARALGSAVYLLGCLYLAETAFPLTSYVVMPGAESGPPAEPYATWATAATNIQDALDVSATNSAYDTILISNGIYESGAALTVTSAVTLRSYNNGAVDRDGTVINGNAAYRCLYVSHPSAIIDGLTISNGYAAPADRGGFGGGIYMEAGALLTNCLFAQNTADMNGGAVFMTNASARIENCFFFNNATVQNAGGGVCLYYSSNLFSACVFSNNAGRFGGGIAMYGFYDTPRIGLELRNCNFFQNYAFADSDSAGGGGVYINENSGGVLVTGCVFQGNTTATCGGGLFMKRCRPEEPARILDCTFENNVSTGKAYDASGGGACIYQSMAIISDCLFASNYAGFAGGGLQIVAYASTVTVIVDRCSIVSNRSRYIAGGVSLSTFPSGANNSNSIVRNSLIAWNTASYHGGGGVAFMTNGTVENCTIIFNNAPRSSDGRGGGVRTGHPGYPPLNGSGSIINTIIYSNTAALEGSNWYHSGIGDLRFYNSCTMPSVAGMGDGNLDADPGFADLAANDFRLAADSPCVDRGKSLDWMDAALDLNGYPRIFGYLHRVDMGAYELRYPGTFFKVR